MEIKVFINNALKADYNNSVLKRIENKFGPVTNDEAKRIISSVQNTDPIFFDDDYFYRLLSLEEILDADADMNVDFESLKIIPLIDLGENDYISFDIKGDTWCKFNIAEEFEYAKKTSIMDYFK